jgi:hypothetical protein
MTPSGAVDYAMIPTYVQYLQEKQACLTGLFVNGTTGEGVLMSVAERKSALEAWIAACAGTPLKVIAHIGCESIADVLDLAVHAHGAKAFALAATAPGAVTVYDRYAGALQPAVTCVVARPAGSSAGGDRDVVVVLGPQFDVRKAPSIGVEGHELYAAWLDGLEHFGRPISLAEIAERGRFDLMVTGASAVSMEGVRFGKGHGFFDLEWGMFTDLGIVDEATPVVAVVHDVQVVEERLFPSPTDIIVDKIPAWNYSATSNPAILPNIEFDPSSAVHPTRACLRPCSGSLTASAAQPTVSHT